MPCLAGQDGKPSAQTRLLPDTFALYLAGQYNNRVRRPSLQWQGDQIRPGDPCALLLSGSS
jgi:hypothetical protein